MLPLNALDISACILVFLAILVHSVTSIKIYILIFRLLLSLMIVMDRYIEKFNVMHEIECKYECKMH